MKIVFMTNGCYQGYHMLDQMIKNGIIPTFCIIQEKLVNSERKKIKNKILSLKRYIHSIYSFKNISVYHREKINKKVYDSFSLISENKIPFKKVKNHNNKISEELLKRISPNLIVLGGAGIIKERIFKIPTIGTLNIHPGLLPEYRGQSVVPWTIYNGDDLGATAHFIDKNIDKGPIVIREKFFGNYRDTWEAKLKVEEFASRVLIKALKQIFVEGKICSSIQDISFPKYMPMEARNLFIINMKLFLKRLFKIK